MGFVRILRDLPLPSRSSHKKGTNFFRPPSSWPLTRDHTNKHLANGGESHDGGFHHRPLSKQNEHFWTKTFCSVHLWLGNHTGSWPFVCVGWGLIQGRGLIHTHKIPLWSLQCGLSGAWHPQCRMGFGAATCWWTEWNTWLCVLDISSGFSLSTSAVLNILNFQTGTGHFEEAVVQPVRVKMGPWSSHKKRTSSLRFRCLVPEFTQRVKKETSQKNGTRFGFFSETFYSPKWAPHKQSHILLLSTNK